jgi:hypothetical protein
VLRSERSFAPERLTFGSVRNCGFHEDDTGRSEQIRTDSPLAHGLLEPSGVAAARGRVSCLCSKLPQCGTPNG